MGTFDLSPLYRSTVGFDKLFNLFDNMLSNDASGNGGYPPYNIERISENVYTITMAVAGFSADDLHIESRENILTIRGEKMDKGDKNELLYQGIGMRSFERRFHLADHVKVADAEQENGLLQIKLEREIPEAARPKKIAIKSAAKSTSKTIGDSGKTA